MGFIGRMPKNEGTKFLSVARRSWRRRHGGCACWHANIRAWRYFYGTKVPNEGTEFLSVA
ncbi:hypothetical protein BRYFOR_06767 [Marvinbryantia formatexigens DSM 14469]|uniref:Uncharacterized protein n=1 Tax=Marvinbryantia formatexigens DSM 14469 TaxID=478749 RepID=C6LDR8_9FIRM|nr:hypothetical protein BRYFOR_06767 [Marvinbryantia formatexigens DSM 14469]